ncbi:hypothetical protein RD792_010752 [Penstemon davidsonii]|uniref:SRR1-like domain-containing protein n=1 Tax=Penstemon davidsonii TaxID=160366 RepID=A0ABR0D438_9LAMI|nr:hypothetical protein RD792_010752 [Penstemon davidsonii]
MAASTKVLSPEKSNLTGDWTVVLPRRGKKSRDYRKFVIPERAKEEQQPWTPTDVETDPERESKLMQKIQICIHKLQNTEFCCMFLGQMQSPNILGRFIKVLGSEDKMQMVIYGIGSIESFEPPRLQVSLAILMRRKFDWIGEIQVFDPVISLTESKVLTSLGCSVLSVNEQGRRQAMKPTMFFMPHCEAELYENLLEANWAVDQLTRFVLFGNSFDLQEQYMSVCRNSVVANSRKHILAARSFTQEFEINTVSDDFFRAFHVPLNMAASTKVLSPEKSNLTEDWTVVLPRRGKKSRDYRKFVIPERAKEEQQPWTPTDVETDPERESKLMQKIQICIHKLQNTEFCLNEQGRRQAMKPTMFFMPHCEAELYENLLEANWAVDQLTRFVLFGNNFDLQEQYMSVCRNSVVANSRKHILAARSFTQEFEINTVSDDFFRAFHGRINFADESLKLPPFLGALQPFQLTQIQMNLAQTLIMVINAVKNSPAIIGGERLGAPVEEEYRPPSPFWIFRF